MKRCMLVYIFIALLLSAPMASANSGVGVFGVSTDTSQTKSVTIASEEEEIMEVTVSETVVIEEPAAEAPVVKTVVKNEVIAVKSGDSLWAIAQKLWGDGSRYPELVEANKDKYPGLAKNPGLIQPGWKLEIPGEEPEVEEPKIEPEKEEAPKDVVVDDKGGSDVDNIPTDKPLTTLEKLNKLNAALAKAKRDLKQRVSEILRNNPKAVDLDVNFLADRGYLNKEDLAGMNPPEGFIYVVKDGRVTLANNERRPISNPELIVMTLREILEAQENKVKVDEKSEGDKKAEEDKKLAQEDSKSKQDAYDSIWKPNKKVEPKVESKVEPKKEEPKKEAKKEEPKKVDPKEVKKAEEVAKTGSEKMYSDTLNKLAMPDFRNMSFKDYRSLEGLRRLLSAKDARKYNAMIYGYTHLIDLQKTHKSLQDTYVKKVDKNDTNWLGGNIKSAGKNVEKNEDKLKKAWAEYQELYKLAEGIAKERQSQLNANKAQIKKLEKELEKIGYDTSKARQNQDLTKQIKKLESANKDLQKDVDAFAKVKNTFGAYK